MNSFKKITLILSLLCIALPVHSMDSGDGDQSYVDRAIYFAQENSGLLLGIGVSIAAGLYLTKEMRNNRAIYGSIWGPSIKQLHVLDQFAGEEYGGGASCGYQALKNAIYITRFLCNKADQEVLTDLIVVQQLFNKKQPRGIWRKLVLENTYRRAIKWQIDQKLYALLISNREVQAIEVPGGVQHLDHKLHDRFKAKIRGFYQGVLANELSAQLVQRIQEPLKAKSLKTSTKVTITRAMLIDAIKSSCRIIERDIEGLEHFDFVAYAKSDAALALYVLDNNPLYDAHTHEITFEVSKSGALAAYNDSNPDNRFDVQGDWINEHEIGLLMRHEQQQGGLLADMPDHFDGIMVIDNVPLLDKGEGEYQEIREIADRLRKADTFIHAFVVGLMSGRPDSVSGSSHWITLVVHKHDGIIEYTVADSGSNASRIRNGIIWKLIKHLVKRA